MALHPGEGSPLLGEALLGQAQEAAVDQKLAPDCIVNFSLQMCVKIVSELQQNLFGYWASTRVITLPAMSFS